MMEAQYLIDARGNSTRGLPSSKQYEKLLADLSDLAVIGERREEKMKRRLKKDGLIQTRP
jgi:hypothetical protein